MGYVVVAIIAFVGGAIVVLVVLETRRKQVEEQKRRQDIQAQQINEANRWIDTTKRALSEEGTRFTAARAEFDARVIAYSELANENTALKRDLRNIDVNLRKLALDGQVQRSNQVEIDKRVNELGGRYLRDNVKWISASLRPNNFSNCKDRLTDVIERCRGIGLLISPDEESALFGDLKSEYERVVRASLEREEQARIKAQIREEQQRQREIDRELKQREREEEAIQVALAAAIAAAKDQHSEEVERLKARLAEAEARTQRTISQAELTKAGHVYVISNIGSFGDGVFKVGMTRRLEPADRVRELGDASVPFPFDVHMMVSCNDAPTLENALHRALHLQRINKSNPRKEFFRTDIETICRIVQENHGEVQYVADAEALEYRQSLSMTEEDQEFIESVYDEAEEDGLAVADEA